MTRKEFLIELANRGQLKEYSRFTKVAFEFEYCWYGIKSCKKCDLNPVCNELFSGSLPYISKDSQYFKDVADIHPEYFL